MTRTAEPRPRTRVAAYALIERGERVLLCRISAQIPTLAGCWTLPGGGLEFGEDPADAVVREVREETGLAVEPTGLVDADSRLLESGREPRRRLHHVRLLYRARILGGELRAEVDGTTDRCAWHTLEEARELPAVSLLGVGLGWIERARGG